MAASAMCGWRLTMEDAHVVDLNGKEAFLGVFDGHGGKEVAIYCGKHILEVLRDNMAFRAGDIESALTETFFKLDENMLTSAGNEELR